MQNILFEHKQLLSGPRKFPGEVTTASGGNMYLRNKVLKLGFKKAFWTLPFPTKHKLESVDDYLQHPVTQPLCYLDGDKEAWPTP